MTGKCRNDVLQFHSKLSPVLDSCVVFQLVSLLCKNIGINLELLVTQGIVVTEKFSI